MLRRLFRRGRMAPAVDPAVEAALDAFLGAKTWPQGLDVLRVHADILLSDAALALMRRKIANLRRRDRKRGRRAQDHAQTPTQTPTQTPAQRLRRHLRLLELARAHGIDEGYVRFQMEALQRQPGMKLLTRIARVNPEMRAFFDRMLRVLIAGPSIMDDPDRLAQTIFPDDPAQREATKAMMSHQRADGGAMPAMSASDAVKALEEMAPALTELATLEDEESEDTIYAGPRRAALLDTLREQVASLNNPLLDAGLAGALAEELRGHPLRDPLDTLRQRIKLLQTAAQTFDREQVPLNWAAAQASLAYLYSELARTLQDTDEWPKGIAAQERSLVYYRRALEVYTRDEHAEEWATLQADLGIEYSRRSLGDRAINIERSLECSRAALDAITREDDPVLWGRIHHNMGNDLIERPLEDHTENLERAVEHFDLALEMCPRDSLLSLLFYAPFHISRSAALERLGRWREAHESLAAAREMLRFFAFSGNSEEGRAETIAEQADMDVCWRDAWAMIRAGDPDPREIAVALEEGRAKAQRVALALDEVDPAGTANPDARARAQAFIAARDAWRETQRVAARRPKDKAGMEAAVDYEQRQNRLSAAYDTFKQARDAIREHDNPDFLALMPDEPEEPTRPMAFEDIMQAVHGQDDAVVYLVTGPDQGFALILTRDQAGEPEARRLALPAFTGEAIDALYLASVERRQGPLNRELYTGGLFPAQIGMAFYLMLASWAMEATEAGEVGLERVSVQDIIAVVPPGSGFRRAAQQLTAQSARNPAIVALLKRPLITLSDEERATLADGFAQIALSLELTHALSTLGALGFDTLAHDLLQRKVRSLTLIPYGKLGIFPLPAASLNIDGTGRRLNDLFEVTIAPSAHAAAVAHRRAAALDREKRPLLLAAGDPRPAPRGINSLPWAEAEADTIRRLARALGYGSETTCYLHPGEVTRENTVRALARSWVAFLALHGEYEAGNPRHSRILLAGAKSETGTELDHEGSLYLSEALDGTIDLKGLRLLVLSACETALADAQRAPDEVIGLAAGFLQAGAAGVLASLWAVDDRATYLLMCRFAQLYLDPRRGWSPARCLAAAQRWLREEATNAVLAQYDPTQLLPVESDPAAGPTSEHTRPRATSERSAATHARPATRKPFLTFGRTRRRARQRALSATRSVRGSHYWARLRIQIEASAAAEQDSAGLPYADPFYWAGFVVTGC